jgi:hypothetical protein
MAPSSIVPIAKALFLCDGAIGFPNQKTDVMGLFNAITPAMYPYVHPQFVVFAQLFGGLGRVPFYFDVRFPSTSELVHTTLPPRFLNFSHRDQVVQLSFTINGCTFAQPGVYLVELFCNAQWVADTKLELFWPEVSDENQT